MPQSDMFTPSTLSVSELTGEIKEILEGHFPDVRVEGEVSNASRSRSGHVYFTLKDESAQLSCVIWRSTRSRSPSNPSATAPNRRSAHTTGFA